MIIDWHTHVHPPKEAARPFWQGRCPATIENVLALHDAADLDISVISSARHYLRNFSREEAVPVVRESNEYMASLRDKHRDKIIGRMDYAYELGDEAFFLGSYEPMRASRASRAIICT
jgi:hypothetical protein